ncbi:sensor histidine kinase [Cohnella abietis]|uniref:histidine kinase n=1 Tax=Cohnella abietis TaxID=2507935 RepID=A0A3T1D077_9BACL|nr:sensor histidine kinase [Cohnella abietis]BBI31503.1 histidine kinase [Cohnella abietis]
MRIRLLPNRFRRLSFKSKLFLSYILIVLIPVSISGVWIYNKVIVPVRGERLQLIEQAMSQLEATVNNDVDDIEKTGYLISTNIVLKKSLLKRYYDQSELIEVMNTSIQSLLSWFEATHKDIGDFRFFTVNETLPESDFFLPISLYSNQGWFQEMKEKIQTTYPYWEHWHVQREYPYGKKTNLPVYSMFYPINEDFTDEASYLEFEIDLGHFFSRSNALTLSQSGKVIAVDWKGKILSGSTEEAYSPQEVMRESTLQHIDLSIEGAGDLTYNGSKYRYVIKPIERLQTSFVGLVPHSEIDGPWMKTKSVFISLIVFLAILLAGLSFLLAGLIIKKIVTIVSHVRKIQNGNFQVRIPVRGEDEIDWLALNINSMAGQIDELVNRVYKSLVSQKEAELSALQAQINPHFLFNTLETLRMMAETGDQPQLSDAITALGSIMRYNIYNGKESVTLATEIEHIQDYMQIQNLLHNNRISLHSTVPENLHSYRIPNLLLQPLVENCIMHGMKDFQGSFRIEITIEKMSDQILRCTVHDNGRGIDPHRLAHIQKQLSLEPDLRSHPSSKNEGGQGAPSRSNGVGLANVSDRILYYFGQASGLTVESSPAQGTIVTLTLPIDQAT